MTISVRILRGVIFYTKDQLRGRAGGRFRAGVLHGDTVVLVTAVSLKSVREGVDFLPLTVDYQEMTFAAGKIPGGFFKREGRPNEREIMTSRIIDRAIRPLFPKGYYSGNPAGGHRAVRGQGKRRGCGGHDRRIRRARNIGHPLQGADCRRAGRPDWRRAGRERVAGKNAGKRNEPFLVGRKRLRRAGRVAPMTSNW